MRKSSTEVSAGPRRLSAATVVVGVIGDPVAHSLSPLLHNTAFAELGMDWVSVGFRVPAGRATEALAGADAMGIRGLSVTMPHKETVTGLVDRASPLAQRLGAVNCVVFGTDGRTGTFGDNTDGAGLLASLWRGAHFDPGGRRCLVVGAGGAARAVVAALADAGAAEVVVLNRTAERAVVASALAGPAGRPGAPEDASACDLVVNATPLGMPGTSAGHGGMWPVDPRLLRTGQTVVDLVYEPAMTPWLQAARDRGATIVNGHGMLVHQAALQLAAWTGLDPPVESMWAALDPPDASEGQVR
ncbi:MAG TPA: shikimate dehydrogenase [Acidimicrobiales bacterium]|nr:shikimate dehydrogenase [Acidimicrobiales bacterium]